MDITTKASLAAAFKVALDRTGFKFAQGEKK
jgi:hypothetical protein